MSRDEAVTAWVQSIYKHDLEFLALVKQITSGRTHCISLRLLDWLVTSYARRHNTLLQTDKSVVHLHSAYKRFLAQYSKRLFDAFKRRRRVYIHADGTIDANDDGHEYYMVSTIGQLCFFVWARDIGVLEYAEKHVRDIERDLKSYKPTDDHDVSSALVVHGSVNISWE